MLHNNTIFDDGNILLIKRSVSVIFYYTVLRNITKPFPINGCINIIKRLCSNYLYYL